MARHDNLVPQRRRYLRLDTVFPVQFRILSQDGQEVFSGWLQGFTNNIGKGGLCLQVNNLKPETARMLEAKKGQIKLELEIELPIGQKDIIARAGIAWCKALPEEKDKYLFGLDYEEIAVKQNRAMLRYGWFKKLFVPVSAAAIVILAAAFSINGYLNAKLTQANKGLVGQLMKILQETSLAKQQVKGINKERQELQLKIQALELEIKSAQEEPPAKDDKKTQAIKDLNVLVANLSQEKNTLQERLIALQHKESRITEELLRLDQRKASLEKANLDKMYQWLKIHQNPRTGLVMSFEGDREIENWAFTYDQALAAQAFSNFSDFERARKVLDFFRYKAKKIDNQFINSYYVNDGSPAEYIVHSGPNIWLGIAAVQYVHKSKDMRYLDLAEGIAQAILKLQKEDTEGGLRGGPNVQWYSTEHNLDAYGFFNMLYKVTQKDIYRQARDKLLGWLITHTYDHQEIPIKRGRGDSTIATDTYAWSIAAIGPEKLGEIGMHPDRIMEFAEENCAVEATFQRPDGSLIKIKGFDFAPQRHMARGGVVSSEWTAQMVVAFKLMSDYYYAQSMVAKARAYEMKADEYLAELSNMIISSPSPSGQGESCLPYATQDFVDTGHGWMTPKGNNTGSVAGTAYTLFAYYKYNPLDLSN